MARAILTKRARKDLIEIRKYTVNRWGKDQARKYLGKIDRCAEGFLASSTLNVAHLSMFAHLHYLSPHQFIVCFAIGTITVTV